MRTFAMLLTLAVVAPAAIAAQPAPPRPQPTFGRVPESMTSTRTITFGRAVSRNALPTANGSTCISRIDAQTAIARGANPIGPVGGPQTDAVVEIPIGGGTPGTAAATARRQNANACGRAR